MLRKIAESLSLFMVFYILVELLMVVVLKFFMLSYVELPLGFIFIKIFAAFILVYAGLTETIWSEIRISALMLSGVLFKGLFITAFALMDFPEIIFVAGLLFFFGMLSFFYSFEAIKDFLKTLFEHFDEDLEEERPFKFQILKITLAVAAFLFFETTFSTIFTLLLVAV